MYDEHINTWHVGLQPHTHIGSVVGVKCSLIVGVKCSLVVGVKCVFTYKGTFSYEDLPQNLDFRRSAA